LCIVYATTKERLILSGFGIQPVVLLRWPNKSLQPTATALSVTDEHW